LKFGSYMSKIGQLPIVVPQGVTVDHNQDTKNISVKGQHGVIDLKYPDILKVNIEGNIIAVTTTSDAKKAKSFHGLIRNTIANAVNGVSKLWEKRLEVVGTGYNVKMDGQNLVLKVGYSHLVTVTKPENITLSTQGNNVIIVKGANKQVVGEVAHKIKMIKKPDPYKGKGVRYEGEVVKLRAGKKAKAGG
jgi:large subunit ribosomal protein L6